MGDPKGLRNRLPAWPESTLAERLSQSRSLLVIHGYLRDAESDRIRARLDRDWHAATPKEAPDA